MKCCFKTHNGWGEDAEVCTSRLKRQEARPMTWNVEWNNCFSDKPTDPKEIRAAYKRVMLIPLAPLPSICCRKRVHGQPQGQAGYRRRHGGICAG